LNFEENCLQIFAKSTFPIATHSSFIPDNYLPPNFCQLNQVVVYCTNSMSIYAPMEAPMATVRKTITLTDQQDEWIKSQISNGDYTNDSEYFRDLIRRDQDKFRALKTAVEKGLASGVSNRTVDEIWAEAERHYQATNE
jgi:antitoxin ParD1/3/4